MALITRQNTVTSDLVYKGQIINLRVDTIASDKRTLTREIVEHTGGVIIACQPELDRVVLVKQYRYALDKEIIELPAGRLDEGEAPLKAAQRELKEETGYSAKDWKPLAKMYSAPGFCNELLYLFHASQASLGETALDEDEEIEVLVPSVKEAWQMVISGQIVDAKTIAGIAMLV